MRVNDGSKGKVVWKECVVLDFVIGRLSAKDSIEMRALVLESKRQLSLRSILIDERLGSSDVRIDIKVVGICGSDIHYYTHGGIGPYVVKEPMILGHEAAGVITEVGSEVSEFRPGDRVCMEPGIPKSSSRASRLGIYNLDPEVRFWATPPIHGVLRPSVVHPADWCFKLPASVTFAAGAMVEPLAVGVHAANKARLKGGDVAVVIGAGPIGLVTVLSALAGGCSEVIISDIDDAKLEIAGKLGAVTTVNVARESLETVTKAKTGGWGADAVFECSGSEKAAAGIFDLLAPNGVVVLVGIPLAPISFDVSKAQSKEARIENVFRYSHVFPRCVNMLASGAIDVAPLITRTFLFEQGVEAFEYAAASPKGQVKIQILMP